MDVGRMGNGGGGRKKEERKRGVEEECLSSLLPSPSSSSSNFFYPFHPHIDTDILRTMTRRERNPIGFTQAMGARMSAETFHSNEREEDYEKEKREGKNKGIY